MTRKAGSALFTALFAISGIVGFVSAAVADDDRGGNNGRINAQLEIEDLMSCYAYTFDAIARAVLVPVDGGAPPDLFTDFSDSDPNYAEGLARFRGCTTDDWTIEVVTVDGVVLLPAGGIPPGALPWVNLVTYLARLDGQTNSQHLFGSFSNSVKGRKGTVTAYAIITTYFDGSGFQSAGTATGTSTYNSDVVFERGKWLLKKTTLTVN